MSSPDHSMVFESAVPSASAARRGTSAPKPAKLSPAALKVAAEPSKSAYSPIVLAGTVRLIEAALVALVGFAVYVAHVVPHDGFAWHYVAAIAGIAVLAMLAFQAADIYQVGAFRGHEKQYMRLASAWSVVFLLAIGASFFAKTGDQFSRVWLAGFYVFGLCTLIAFRRALFLLVRRWTREGRLDRRTVVVGADGNGETLIGSLASHAKLRHSRRWPRSATPTCASSAYSTIAATSAVRQAARGCKNLAPSTNWWSSPAILASIW